jgi:imidazolonepropionase-like amidohydrolase
VFAHAYGGPGINDAVRAGVRSIEHGAFLTEPQAAAMAQTGCWPVPTLSVLDEVVGMAQNGPSYRRTGSKALELETAPGLGRPSASQIALLCRYGGMPVEEALLTATLRGAELCGVAATRGRIAPG